MQPELLLWLIPIPPLVSFFTIILLTSRRNKLSHRIAIASIVISWLLSMAVIVLAFRQGDLGHHPFESSIPWLTAGSSVLSIGVLLDPLTVLVLFFVVWTCLPIFVYSVGYHNYGKDRNPDDKQGLPPSDGGLEPMYARFFAFISLFAFGMLLLVVSDNLLTLFAGWEIMGLCSFLLIGFWFAKNSAKRAMVKAFMVTRVGDVVMLLGIVYLWSVTGTLSFKEIFGNEEMMGILTEAPSIIPALSIAGMIGLLLFVGTVAKSAQWPLHVWLPDAMEGPTPVSAMIHAATMVSAGIYLILRVFPLISAGWHEGLPLTPTMLIIAAIGTFTAFFGSLLAVGQNDIKRVLAYSTISQLGYMVAGVGIGAFVAAAFHLLTHAFFKALLFLGSGSVIHGVEHGVHETHEHIDPQDMYNMGGLRKKMPLTFWTFLIGGLALSGFPILTAGFWSKDELLAHAFVEHQLLVFVLLASAAFLTAFYTMRQITLTFLGKPKTEAAAHAHESVRSMTGPLVVLAFFAIVIGWIGIPSDFPVLGGLIPNFVHDLVGETLVEHPEEIAFNYIPVVTSIVLALLGLLLGWLLYRNVTEESEEPLARALGPVYRWIQNKFYFDELYEWGVRRPFYWFAESFTYKFLDRRVIDGLLNWIAGASLRLGGWLRRAIDLPIINGFGDAVGSGVKEGGSRFRYIQTGRVQQYLIAAVFFTALLVSYIVLFGTRP